MEEKVRIIDPGDDKRWDQFAIQHPDSTIYHHSLWKKVIQETYQYEPLYIVLEDSNGHIKGGIPFFFVKSFITGNRLVSLPFSDYSEVLVHHQEDLRLLLKESMEKASELNASYIEIRTRKTHRIFPDKLFRERAYFINHFLQLDVPPEELRKKFHKNCINRNIKKAEKSPLEVREGSVEKDMKIFFHLQSITRKKHGLPPQPYSFFKNMWKILHPQQFLQLLLVRYQGKDIAAMVFLKYKDTMYYKYGASDNRYLAHHPNHLLMWKAIEHACQEGFRFFDFGRTAPEDKGLMDFKKRWGSLELGLPYFFYPHRMGISLTDRDSLKYRMISTASHLLPVSILKIGGRIIYKHLG